MPNLHTFHLNRNSFNISHGLSKKIRNPIIKRLFWTKGKLLVLSNWVNEQSKNYHLVLPAIMTYHICPEISSPYWLKLNIWRIFVLDIIPISWRKFILIYFALVLTLARKDWNTRWYYFQLSWNAIIWFSIWSWLIFGNFENLMKFQRGLINIGMYSICCYSY